MKIKSPRPL